MQQSVALHRLSCSEDGDARILSLFSYKQSGVLKPRLLQIYGWQIPVMLLNISILMFLLGLVVLVFHEAFHGLKDWKVSLMIRLVWPSSKYFRADYLAKMAFAFSVVALFGGGNYLFSTVTLYKGLEDLKS
jgi:hypothetical protein